MSPLYVPRTALIHSSITTEVLALTFEAGLDMEE